MPNTTYGRYRACCRRRSWLRQNRGFFYGRRSAWILQKLSRRLQSRSKLDGCRVHGRKLGINLRNLEAFSPLFPHERG